MPNPAQLFVSTPLLAVEGLTAACRTAEGWRRVVDAGSFALHSAETLAIAGETSPIHPRGHVPAPLAYARVGDGHFVLADA